MTEYERLKARFKEAASCGQYDIAATYFYAAIEVGAKEMDKRRPGSGDLWRGLGRAVENLEP